MAGGSSEVRVADSTPARVHDGELWSAVLDDLNHAGESMDTTLRRLAQRAARMLSSSSTIFLLTPAGLLRPAAFWDDDPKRLAGLTALLTGTEARSDLGLFQQVVHQGEPALVTSAAARIPGDPGSPYARFPQFSGLDSYLLVPMSADGVTVGVLAIGRYSPARALDVSMIPDASRIAAAGARVVRVAALVQRGKVADLALNAMRDAVIAVDTAGSITSWNRGAAHLYGYAESEALGRRMSDLVYSEPIDGDEPPFDPNRPEQAGVAAVAWMGRLRQRRRDGAQRIVESVISPTADEPAQRRGAVLVNRDISGVVEIGTALRRQELLAQAALDASPLIVGVFDSDGTLLACSRGWRELLGGDPAPRGSIRSFAEDLLCNPGDERRLLEAFTKVLAGAPHDHSDYEVECGALQRTLAITTSRVEGIGATITITDVSDRARRERELAYSATHDSVTGLPNRGALYARAVHALNRAARNGTKVGLLFCDLDGFKDLNDQFGHGAGDDLLTSFGERLVESCRISDSVARVGGDEFAVLLEDDVSEEALSAVAQRIIAGAAHSLRIPAGRITVTASVGAVLETGVQGRSYSEKDVDDLIERADIAMYHAKSRGRNRWSKYDSSLRYLAQHRAAVTTDLDAAVRRGEITVFYQPQFGRSGELIGAEAMLRWFDPERGVVEPHELITSLGGIPLLAAEAALAAALDDLSRWRAGVPPGFRLTLNISRDQWTQRLFADSLLQLLSDYRIPAPLVRIEVDPAVLGAVPDHSAAATRRLADAGVEVAVNGLDFSAVGLTGMRRFAIGCLVLSGRFVRDAAAAGGELLSGMVALARQLGWRVIATGVETDEQLNTVRGAGCSYAQGLVLAPPIPAAQFAAEFLPAVPAVGERPSARRPNATAPR